MAHRVPLAINSASTRAALACAASRCAPSVPIAPSTTNAQRSSARAKASVVCRRIDFMRHRTRPRLRPLFGTVYERLTAGPRARRLRGGFPGAAWSTPNRNGRVVFLTLLDPRRIDPATSTNARDDLGELVGVVLGDLDRVSDRRKIHADRTPDVLISAIRDRVGHGPGKVRERMTASARPDHAEAFPGLVEGYPEQARDLSELLLALLGVREKFPCFVHFHRATGGSRTRTRPATRRGRRVRRSQRAGDPARCC
jgi:hypothetical protein